MSKEPIRSRKKETPSVSRDQTNLFLLRGPEGSYYLRYDPKDGGHLYPLNDRNASPTISITQVHQHVTLEKIYEDANVQNALGKARRGLLTPEEIRNLEA